jgi:hypothetical protein
MTSDAPEPQLSGNIDVDEFMAFLETRPKGERWDLIEGVAVMMSPATLAHRRITINLCNLLNSAFASLRLDLFAYVGFASGRRASGTFNRSRTWRSFLGSPATISTRNASDSSRKSCHR